MRTSINIIVLTVVIFFTTVSCIVNNIGENIEKYVERNCNFEEIDECYIDLKKALKVEYDTLFIIEGMMNEVLFKSISGYTMKKNFFHYWLVDEDVYLFVFKKNNKVVYSNFSSLYSKRLSINLDSFNRIYATKNIDDYEDCYFGYFSADSLFIVKRYKFNGGNVRYELLCRPIDSKKKQYIKKNAIPIFQNKTGEKINEEGWTIIE